MGALKPSWVSIFHCTVVSTCGWGMQLLVPHLLWGFPGAERCLLALLKSHIPQDVLAHRDVLVPHPPLPAVHLMGVAPNPCPHDPVTPWRGTKALRYLCVCSRENWCHQFNINILVPQWCVYLTCRNIRKSRFRVAGGAGLQCYVIGGCWSPIIFSGNIEQGSAGSTCINGFVC